jgi:hypothetical protein
MNDNPEGPDMAAATSTKTLPIAEVAKAAADQIVSNVRQTTDLAVELGRGWIDFAAANAPALPAFDPPVAELKGLVSAGYAQVEAVLAAQRSVASKLVDQLTSR